MKAPLKMLAQKSAGAGVGLIMFLSAGGFIVPERAHAQLVVVDAVQQTLDYVLDPLAWQLANLAIESITKSTVNWINSGFEGSPAFVTDLNENLRGVGDTVANRFFAELANEASDIKTSPFQDRVLDSIRLGYYLRTSPESFYTRNPYTLDQVSSNDRAFLAGDFSQGGFDALFSAVMNPNNNPYSAQLLANQALENAVAGATNTRLEELSWNRGFLQWCGDSISDEADDAEAVSLETEDQCVGRATRTPGTVIQEQLNKATNSGLERLTVADDFNEIIGALLNQLAMQVLGGGEGGGGLTGASRPSSGGGSSFIDRTRSTPGQGSGSSIAASFTATIERQIAQTETFQANWVRIRDAAQAAALACSEEDDRDEAERVLDRASDQLVRAANALTALRGLLADIDEASTGGGDQSGALATVSSNFSVLISSNVLLTPEEVSEADIESRDSGNDEPGSLYSQMRDLASQPSCDGN